MTLDQQEHIFYQLIDQSLQILKSDEYLTLELIGEQSQFIRFNHAQVRQIGIVNDGQLKLTLIQGSRNAFREFPLTGHWETDWHSTQTALDDLRQELPHLPVDPYSVTPTGQATSREVRLGQLLDPIEAPNLILQEVLGLDFVGFYAGGYLIRAYADSAGTRHWFATETYALDYSLFTPDGQAVKGIFAGNHWQPNAYSAKIADSKHQLQRMAHPPKSIPKGQYRTYLAPGAVSDLIGMFSWGAVSEASMQRGGSALGLLQRGEKTLSPLFSLTENFDRGIVPRFNSWGEIAPLQLPLIDQGQLVNTLVNSRTAKEYGKPANGANRWETLRSPEVAPGCLSTDRILTELDTGLYLSNLHYLNWSDRPAGRVTGMTRYACFWVEQGAIVAPIENLRFDESLYRCFGNNLVALTDVQEFIAEVGTYEHRDLGGMWVPGMLVNDFTYTL